MLNIKNGTKPLTKVYEIETLCFYIRERRLNDCSS